MPLRYLQGTENLEIWEEVLSLGTYNSCNFCTGISLGLSIDEKTREGSRAKFFIVLKPEISRLGRSIDARGERALL